MYKLITPEYGDSYIEWDDNGIIRFIPLDESNSDYQAYLASLDEQQAALNATIQPTE